MYNVHICSFSSSVADLKNYKRTPEHLRRTPENVLSCLKENNRVSTWDMSENEWLRNIIYGLENKGLIVEQKSEYPWHIFKPVDTNEPTEER